jgi:RNA polymerase sigma-70 factor, ECF subfamily
VFDLLPACIPALDAKHSCVQAASVRVPTAGDRGASRMDESKARKSPSERDAFIALVRKHDRDLRMLVYRLVGDADAMDDILQDAYLRSYRALPGFRREASLATWLYRITYNLCLDRLRSRARPAELATPLSLDLMAEDGWEPAARRADLSDEIALRGDLQQALAALHPEQRAAVLLVDAIGYDYSTSAQILGIREGTLASRLHQSRAVLRHALSDTV